MSCTRPPALTDDDLSAVLDGAEPAGAYEHLAICPGCAARLERARHDEYTLKAALYRWDCPTAQRLGEAELGLLPEPETHAIQQHLAECHACAAEAEELRRFMATSTITRSKDEAPERSGSAFVQKFAGVVAMILPREMAVAVRGAETTPLVATALGVTVVLDPQPASLAHVLVVGQVAGDDQERWAGALVELRQAERVQAVATVDELGGFRCGPVTAGRADLRITPERGEPVVLLNLLLGESAI